MSKRYIIGDPHFDHNNIIGFSNRPFENVDEMNEQLVLRWNSIVRPEDRVYLNGDISMKRKSLHWLSQLNGHKVLIKGNHDVWPLKDYLPYFDDIRSYIVEDGIIISHIPIYKDQKFERFIGNIHAHLHERIIDDPFYLSCSAEQINYTPALLESLKDILIERHLNKTLI